MNYLNEYKTFNSVQELNYHVKLHTNRKYHDMNETQRQVLQVIPQYSVKYAGASHLRIQTIANALGKSRRTVERAIRALIKLNVIERINTTRKVSGGKGANIYRILPYKDNEVVSESSHRKESEKSTETRDTTPIVENQSANFQSCINNTLQDTAKPNNPSLDNLIKRGIRSAIPAPIYDALAPFFDGETLYDIIGVLFRAKASVDRSIRVEHFCDEYIEVFLNVIRNKKLGKVSSFRGALYQSWQRVTGEISRRICFLNGCNNTLRIFDEIINKTDEEAIYIYE